MPKYTREEYPVNAIVYERDCHHCGQHFWGNKPSATYCSPKCRAYANKQKRETRQTAEAAYEADPIEAGLRFGPVLTGKGAAMQVLYDNIIQDELQQLDPDGTLLLNHLLKKAVQPLDKLTTYCTLLMKRDRVYYNTLKRLLEPDGPSGFGQLSAEQSGFLREEMRRVDGRILEHQSRLSRLRNADKGAYVEW